MKTLLPTVLLDQQIPMEWAFKSPSRLAERLGGELDASAIAAMDPADLEAAFCTKPAMHRFPAAMARRAHELCRHVADEYDGEVGAVWSSASSGRELYDRVRALPGYGDEKSMIFLAIWPSDSPSVPGGGSRTPAVRRRHPPLGGRHRQPGRTHQGAGLEKGAEGRGQIQAGTTPKRRSHPLRFDGQLQP